MDGVCYLPISTTAHSECVRVSGNMIKTLKSVQSACFSPITFTWAVQQDTCTHNRVISILKYGSATIQFTATRDRHKLVVLLNDCQMVYVCVRVRMFMSETERASLCVCFHLCLCIFVSLGHFFTNPPSSRTNVFIHTLFFRLILSLAEHNYSLLNRRRCRKANTQPCLISTLHRTSQCTESEKEKERRTARR